MRHFPAYRPVAHLTIETVGSLEILRRRPDGIPPAEAKVTGAGFLGTLERFRHLGYAEFDADGRVRITQEGIEALDAYRKANPID